MHSLDDGISGLNISNVLLPLFILVLVVLVLAGRAFLSHQPSFGTQYLPYIIYLRDCQLVPRFNVAFRLSPAHYNHNVKFPAASPTFSSFLIDIDLTSHTWSNISKSALLPFIPYKLTTPLLNPHLFAKVIVLENKRGEIRSHSWSRPLVFHTQLAQDVESLRTAHLNHVHRC